MERMGNQMMNKMLAFDTLKYANRLKEADVPPKQAEMQAEMMRDVLETAFQAAELATKSDIDTAAALSRKDVESLEQRLKLEITAIENKIVIRVGKMMLATVGLACVLIPLIVKLIT